MFILLLFIIVCCERAVGLAGPFIAAVLEELKEVESERMHEGSEAAHREVQDVAEADVRAKQMMFTPGTSIP